MRNSKSVGAHLELWYYFTTCLTSKWVVQYFTGTIIVTAHGGLKLQKEFSLRAQCSSRHSLSMVRKPSWEDSLTVDECKNPTFSSTSLCKNFILAFFYYYLLLCPYSQYTCEIRSLQKVFWGLCWSS